MNDGQRAHVRERLAAGATEQEMVDYLVSEGVDHQVAVADVAAEAARFAATTGLPAVGALVAESWQFAKSRFDLVGWYVVISLVPLVLIAVPAALGVTLNAYAANWLWLVIPVGVAVLVLMIWVMVVASAGLFYAVAQSETTQFTEGWQWARPRFWQIAWIAALLMLVFIPATVALVVPALVLMVFTMFYFLSYMQHEHTGLHALAASTNIVYGRFWGLFGRLAAVVLLIVVISLLITLFFAALGSLVPVGEVALLTIGEVINMIVSFFLTIMVMRYLVLLYSAAAASAPTYQPEPLSTSYKLYRVLAWLGAFIVVVGFGGTLLAFLGFAG